MDRFVEFLLYLQGPIPYLAAFLVLLGCGFGVPIPEDIVLFAMGLLSYYGLVDLKISILVCFAGVLIGDVTVFYLGRHFGVRLLKKKLFAKFLHPERMGRTRELLLRWGNKVIFAARFMPGLRAPMFFSAGTFQLPFRVFIFYDGLAALLSVPLLVGVVFYFGDHVHRVIVVARKVQHGIVGLILAIVLFFVVKHFISKTRAARQSR
ncbi:MAG: DedA family protein [Deltaproteobacteria bacterium]|nr:DedA family protein [Deltaproteobacteria bacterium]